MDSITADFMAALQQGLGAPGPSWGEDDEDGQPTGRALLQGGADDYLTFLASTVDLKLEHIPSNSITKLGEPLGAGATATVYAGRWAPSQPDSRQGHRVVAVKYVNISIPQGASSLLELDSGIKTRLKVISTELRALADSYTNGQRGFPRIFGISWEERKSPVGVPLCLPIVVMEAADSTLEQYIRDQRNIHQQRHEEEERFITSIHAAMSFLHQRLYLVHGDLKPSNVLIFLDSQKQRVDLKLADFGFAHNVFFWQSEQADSSPDHDLGAGFSRYWSGPEANHPLILQRFAGIDGRHPWDYYSFGLLIWFILFGYPSGAQNSDRLRPPTEEEEIEFQRSKLQHVEMLDMLDQAFSGRWRWRVTDYPKQINDSIDFNIRQKILIELIRDNKILEEEFDPISKHWGPTKSKLHHVYRACIETCLHANPLDRVCIVQQRPDQIFDTSLSRTFASYYMAGCPNPDLDPKLETNREDAKSFSHRLGYYAYADRGYDHTELGVPEPPILALPESLAKELMNHALETAAVEEDESGQPKPRSQRLGIYRTLQNFATRFPDTVDKTEWLEKEAMLGAPRDRLRYLAHLRAGNLLRGGQDDTATLERHIQWILDGVTHLGLNSEERDEPGQPSTLTRALLNRLVAQQTSPEPLRIAAREAFWDYMTDVAPAWPIPDYTGQGVPPVFQAIVDGEIDKLRELLASTNHDTLHSLTFDDYNLLQFATMQRKPAAVRILMSEFLFDPIFRGSADSAIQLAARAGYNDIMLELCYSYDLDAVKHHWTSIDDDGPIRNPAMDLFRPLVLASMARLGTEMSMVFIDQTYRKPTQTMIQFALDGYRNMLDEDEDPLTTEPLVSAIYGRRLRNFLRFASWGFPSRPQYPVNSFGGALLEYAVDVLAPFFVAALLACGADPNAVGVEGLAPLQRVCRGDAEAYVEAIRRRVQLQTDMDLGAEIVKRSGMSLDTTEEDSLALRKVIVDLLLLSGADINLGADEDQDFDPDSTDFLPGGQQALSEARGLGMGPLACCIATGKSDLAVHLIQRGAGVHVKSGTISPIIHAISADLVDVVAMLLDHGGISVESVYDGLPLLFEANKAQSPASFELLLKRGASLSSIAMQGDAQITVFDLLLCSPIKDVMPWLRLWKTLVEHIELSLSDEERESLMNKRSMGSLPIHTAALSIRGGSLDGGYNAKLVRMIIENTESPFSAKDVDGDTALHLAWASGNGWFIRVFLGCHLRDVSG